MKQTKYLILSALFAVLTAAGAYIRIPIGASYATLQVVFPCMAGVLLGKKWGAVSQIIYLLLGLTGLPIFATGGGPGAFLQPTGGFLLALVPMAWVVGAGSGTSFWKICRSCVLGLCVLYAIGLPYMHLILTCYLHRDWSIWQTLLGGMVVFLPLDAVKIAAAAFLCMRIRNAVTKIL